MRLHINFIADRLQDRREAARLARYGPWWIVAGGLLSLGVMLVVLTLASNNARNLQQAAEVRRSRAGLAEQARFVAGEIKRLQAPEQLARGARSNSARWVGLLKELRDRLPAEAWLTGIEIQPPPGGEAAEAVTVRGQAVGHNAIGQYVAALCGSPWFADAALVRSGDEEPRAEASGPIDFELSARLKQPLMPLAEAGS